MNQGIQDKITPVSDAVPLASEKSVTVGMLMPNFNHGAFLEQAFAQMAAQTMPVAEIVVVDDGSTDDSVKKIKKWAAESPTHKAVLLEKNSGVNAATSAGLHQLTTDFFFPRSVDDTYFPTKTEQITRLAIAHPNCGLITCRPLRHDVASGKRFLSPKICDTSRFFTAREAENALKRNYLWDAGIAWRRSAFVSERDGDWRMRWVYQLHVADVLALRHGFCYVAEPLMEYNMRPNSYSNGGNDPLRQAEVFLASARDWCSPAKADLFNACVRSGFLGLRENPLVPILAVLNGSWQDHGKPILVILQGLIEQLDQHHAKAGVLPDRPLRQELAMTNRIFGNYAQDYAEQPVLDTLIPFLLKVIPNTALNNPLIGFFASYLVRTGRYEEAQDLLHNRLAPGKRCKAVLRAQAQLATHTDGAAAGDRAWREAIAANPADVWFGMEYVRILLDRGETEAALGLAHELYQRDNKSDVLKELTEILPDFNPARDGTNQKVERVDPNALERGSSQTNALGSMRSTTPSTPAIVTSGRPPVRILFVSEKWCEKPGGALTNTIHNIFGSFKATGFGTYENFFIEEHVNVDADLLRHTHTYKPDLLIITYPTHHPKSPKATTFKTLHAEGYKMGFLWWDAVNPYIMALADEVAPYCRANFILDFNSFQKDPRYVAVWTPQDPTIYCNPGLSRTIDVSFAGSINGMPERQAYLKFLAEKNIKVTQAGGQREQNLTVHDYAKVYQQSKITLNFTKNRFNLFQTKGRSWEALSCGTVLFEQDNAEIRRWLTPGVDYVPFNTPAELHQQLTRFLTNPKLLEDFGRGGEATFQQNYTAAHWWRIVLDRCLTEQQIIAPAVTETDADSTEVFSAADVTSITSLHQTWQGNPDQTEKLTELQAIRQEVSAFLLETDPAALAALYTTNFGRIYDLFLRGGLPNETPTTEDNAILATLRLRLEPTDGTPPDFRALLAFALFRPAHESATIFPSDAVPDWFWDNYLTYNLSAPQGFTAKGEGDRYFSHLLAWAKMVAARIEAAPKNELTLKLSHATTIKLNLIPVYFTAADVRELMTLRAEIMSFTLRSAGHQLEARFPARPRGNRKIRVGFLNAHFGSQTETYTTLPTLHLDRTKFEIQLFALSKGKGPLIDYCRKNSDYFIELPANLNEQVATLRAAALDIIVIGTNVTAVTNQIALIALHKLAPIQLTSCSSPMTTGMKTFDGYLSGTIRGLDAYGQHYTEPLLLLDAPINCFEFTHDPAPVTINPTRKDLGIADDAVLFVSGANFHKIIPELQETWIKILQRVPGSTLLLHPFNPNWSNQYPVKQFNRQLQALLAKYGVDPKRLLISTTTLPSRTDVGAMMALGDIYLDSYPLSGSVSMVDPLQAGVPPVIWRGEVFRSLMATSMLRDLELEELITDNEADYIELAVRLAGDATLRQQLREKIRLKMSQAPRFFACADYGRDVSVALETLFEKSQSKEAQKTPTPSQLVDVTS